MPSPTCKRGSNASNLPLTDLELRLRQTGAEQIEKAYAEALGHGYLWHEFGDLHLII